MIQTGDPTGLGKGGQSIWAKPFEDEIRSTIKVRKKRAISRSHLLGAAATLCFPFLSVAANLTDAFLSLPRFPV